MSQSVMILYLNRTHLKRFKNETARIQELEQLELIMRTLSRQEPRVLLLNYAFPLYTPIV